MIFNAWYSTFYRKMAQLHIGTKVLANGVCSTYLLGEKKYAIIFLTSGKNK